MRSNAVAYERPRRRRSKRGRPRFYGKKLKLKHRFKLKDRFHSAPSPVYYDRHITLLYP